MGLEHRLDCLGSSWPSPSSELAWEGKAALLVPVGSSEALASRLQRWVGLQRAILYRVVGAEPSAKVLCESGARLLPFWSGPCLLAPLRRAPDPKQAFRLPQLDWAAFGVMTLPSIGVPLLLWYSSKRKYDTPKAKKN